LPLGVGNQSGIKNPKPSTIVTSPTKNLKSKTYPAFLIETTRFIGSLEGLNSSLTEPAGELYASKPGQIEVV